MKELPIGFPTHSIDINGNTICLGDTVTYDFDDSTTNDNFIVVFELNAFRKKYRGWDKTIEKPLLEYAYNAERMRLKIVKKAKINAK